MARILLLDQDEMNLKLMKEALSLTGQEDENASFQSEDVHCFAIPEPLKPEEIPKGKTPDPFDHIFKALNSKTFDFIFMEASQVGNNPGKFVEDFRKKITLEQNKNIPIVLLTYNDDIDFVRKMTIQGIFADMLLKPADAPHFRQKFSLLVSKQGSYKKELYTMPTLQPVNVAYNFLIEDISEFGLILKSNRPYKTGEFVTFYSPVFKTEKRAEVIGKCYKYEKLGSAEEYRSYFVFVAIGDTMRKQIRNWMKQEYVRKKQAA